MKKSTLFSILCAIMIFCFATVNASAQTGSIAGTVTDADTGLPLEGVMVKAMPVDEEIDGHGHGGPGGGHGGGWWHHWMAITGEDGTYLIDEMDAGLYEVTARGDGYYSADTEIEVVDGEMATADFALEGLVFGALSGTVTDADTALPLAGAFVRVSVAEPAKTKTHILGTGSRHWGGGCGQHYFAMTGDDGTYSIDNVIVDYYEVRASMCGYNAADPVGLFVMEGETAVADFALTPMTYGALEGYVTDADTGDPIEGAWVMLRMGEGTLHHGGGGGGWGGGWGGSHNWAITDENGYYLMDQVATGAYIGYAMSWYYEYGEGSVTIVEDETAQLDFALVAGVE